MESRIIPGARVEAITASDTVNFTGGTARAIYIGTAGNAAIVMQDNSVATFVGLLAGSMLPLSAKRINSTNTTASNMVAIF